MYLEEIVHSSSKEFKFWRNFSVNYSFVGHNIKKVLQQNSVSKFEFISKEECITFFYQIISLIVFKNKIYNYFHKYFKFPKPGVGVVCVMKRFLNYYFSTNIYSKHPMSVIYNKINFMQECVLFPGISLYLHKFLLKHNIPNQHYTKRQPQNIKTNNNDNNYYCYDNICIKILQNNCKHILRHFNMQATQPTTGITSNILQHFLTFRLQPVARQNSLPHQEPKHTHACMCARLEVVASHATTPAATKNI